MAGTESNFIMILLVFVLLVIICITWWPKSRYDPQKKLETDMKKLDDKLKQISEKMDQDKASAPPEIKRIDKKIKLVDKRVKELDPEIKKIDQKIKQVDQKIEQVDPGPDPESTKKTTKKTKDEVKQQIYTEILTRAKRAMDRIHVPWFLSSGTCLGYYREGQFIKHDYDIDIGIMEYDYTPKIIEEFEKEGLKLYRTLGTLENGYELSFRMPGTPLRRHAKIDVFLHYYENNYRDIYWTSYAWPRFKRRIKYRVPAFKIGKANFMGLDVGVPTPTDKYLENHYGKDWHIPKKPKNQGGSYFYSTSPNSIVKE